MAPALQSSHQRPARQPRPVRASRTQVQSYNEESSADERLDEDTEPDEDRSRRLSLSLRPRDPHRMPASYREESTDNDLEDALDDDPDVVLPAETPVPRAYPISESATRTTQPTHTRSRRNRKIKTRSQSSKLKRTPNKRRLELGRPLHKRRKVQDEDVPFVGSSIIPPWQTLPYHILFDIFLCASYPLIDEKAVRRNNSVNWLVNVALLCRGFCEPALAALYHSPPLIPATKSHSLLSLLSKPQESLSTNYVNKIKELHIDVETLLVYKSGPTLGYFDLPKLIERTPQVRILRLYHNDDYVVGLPLWQIPRSKWVYPEALFTAIGSSSIQLSSWDWNSRFMETKRLLPYMIAKHLHPSFKNIQELRILHVASEDADGGEVSEMSNEREVVLATAFKELSQLHRLEFLESSILNDHLFLNLPINLSSLIINNCDDVTTTNFGAFLSTHGHNLRELNLSHNRHLSLSFIVNLEKSCQRLEKFKMDISMHDWSSYHDVEPHFEELLSSSQVPTWPATLQDLELIHLRKWDDKTAEVFFASLIEAAPQLQNLRRLVISAILKTGWRDRASFREKWIGRLEKVFLRHSSPPNPNLRTLPQPTQQSIPDEGAAHSDAHSGDPSTPSKRKSARIAERKFSEPEEIHNQPQRSRRTQKDDGDPDLPFIQGMCDVVMVRIDNQRPTENQFNEQDFLDDELSGDEDWNGGDWGDAW
ncbi:hypothetical protein P175DRAFT_0455341 [Aspergillus ochraceoroseus IBT 24754]|uniref:Uncharacterized protein n=1 Tax=Aspergillus ochraceoroseus IBT 24754 TaxID=1392256 RepID=A0A2T5M4P1_9EURO|nr:uncharacterized protein P175DRAFT_0455341 [Aspergillus ochraceoroseus IBT 24754]PTU23484.1 hypothetical protein P175DRAFT_0455341 [Aspergillus ochraceoroseus IBT 24754]